MPSWKILRASPSAFLTNMDFWQVARSSQPVQRGATNWRLFRIYFFRNPNALHFSMTNLANFSARKKLAGMSDDSCWRISYVPKLAASQPGARLYVSFLSFKVTGISMFRMINEQQGEMSSACCIYFQLDWRPREWLRTRWIESEWCLSEIIQYIHWSAFMSLL